MNTLEKIETLGTAAKYDVCASTSCTPDAVKSSRGGVERVGSVTGPGICHSFTPDGRCVSLFKVLMTNQCQGDCKYCINNCEMHIKRASFETDELKDTFLKLYHQNRVEGLFLSSAVKQTADIIEERMIEVVEKLRFGEGFHGYIHLKIMPGTSKDLVKRATEIADRVSLNLEAPNRLRFQEISSTKDFGIDLIRRMRWAQRALDKRKSSGQTTQFVVGACEESDREILSTVDDVYAKLDLRRSYFSAFIPVKGTSLEGHATTPLLREHRLYQCDFLMRKYGFRLDEFVFEDDERLDLKVDPKMKVALGNRNLFPIEINGATYADLLRVPGIGPQCAQRISKSLEDGFRFMDTKELKNLGVVLKRASTFISINGKQQTNLTAFQAVTA
jgi:putative DNA modification/repair radical SAM protein